MQQNLPLENKLKQLQQGIELNAKPIKEESMVNLFFQRLPLINKMVKLLDKTGLGTAKATHYFNQSAGSVKAAQGLQVTGAVIAGLDFITIPLAWVAYKLSGKPFPYSFSKGVKFVYSMTVVALTIAVLLVAPTLALILTLTTASLGLGSAIVGLVRHGWLKRRLNKEELLCKQDIRNLTEQLKTLKTKDIPNALAIEKGKKPEDYLDTINQLYSEQQSIVNQLQQKLDRLAEVTHRKQQVGTRATVDKTVGFALSCATLAGVICLIIAPPIGMFILAVTISSAVTYVVGRGLFEAIKPQPKHQDPSPITIAYEKVEHHSSSTLSTSLLLSDSKQDTKELLHKLFDETHNLNEIQEAAENIIAHIISEKDEHLALDFLSRIGMVLKQSEYEASVIKNFVTELPQFQEALPIIKHALNNLAADEHPSFSQEKLTNLNYIPAVKKYMAQKHKDAESTPLCLEQFFQPQFQH